MDLQKSYDFDEKLAEEGRRIPLSKDSYIVVAKFGNKKFTDRFNKLTAKYGKRVDRIPAEEKEEIYLDCFAHTILIDWGGIRDGEEHVEYSPENVIKVCKKYPDFHAEVLEMSRDIAVFQAEDQAEDLGNSQTSSEPS